MESWRNIPGYEGLYMVSDHGRVKSLKFRNNRADIERERILSAVVKDNQYLYVTLHKDGVRRNKYIHRLVAEAFVPNPEGKPVVNHKDYDVTNNVPSNLEWCSQRENVLHSSDRMKHTHNSWRLSATGEKYIYVRRGRYRLNIGGVVDRHFETLEEAVSYRNKLLKER